MVSLLCKYAGHPSPRVPALPARYCAMGAIHTRPQPPFRFRMKIRKKKIKENFLKWRRMMEFPSVTFWKPPFFFFAKYARELRRKEQVRHAFPQGLIVQYPYMYNTYMQSQVHTLHITLCHPFFLSLFSGQANLCTEYSCHICIAIICPSSAITKASMYNMQML